jgi:hypothetical protein
METAIHLAKGQQTGPLKPLKVSVIGRINLLLLTASYRAVVYQ